MIQHHPKQHSTAQGSTAKYTTQNNTTQQNRKDEDNDCWDCSRGSGSDNGEWTEV